VTSAWPTVPLSNIIGALRAGVSVNATDDVVDGDAEIGVLKVSCVSQGRFRPLQNKKVLPDDVGRVAESPKRGDIIISRANTFDLVGASGYVEEDHPNLFLSDKLWRVELAEPSIDSARWLIALLNSQKLRREFCRRATGTSGSMKNISQESILSIQVPRPPRNVQSRLGAVFEQFETLATQLGAQARANRSLKRGLMQQLLTGQKRFPAYRNEKWRSVALGDLIRYTPRKVPKPPGTFLSAGIRSHGKGVFLKKDFHADGIALDELFELKHRDLVVNITFGWEGAVAIVPPEADGALVSHRFPTYEVDESKVLVEYLRHVIQARRFVFDVGVASPGGAGRNRVLNRQEFLEIVVKVPGVEEQGQMAQLLNDCDRELDLLAAQREQVENFRRALLSLLLSGSLVVPS
jgi:type I restriction enzyme, S subunit